jgi:hypothetical protein
MSRRGSKNPEKDIEVWIRDQMGSKVESMMNNRHMLMVPFPVPAMDVYMTLWTPAQLEAMNLFRGIHVLKMHREFTIIGCPGPDGKGIRRVTVTMDEDHPLPRDLNMPFAGLPDGMRELIQAWIPTWMQYNKETMNVVSKVKRIGSVCSTYGQVVRLWPELQGFLGEWGAEKVHKAKAKSPYPDGAIKWVDPDPTDSNVDVVADGLEDEFKPETYAPLTHMIAECLMLPEIDNLIHVGRVQG